MSSEVVLDSGPVGLLSNPKSAGESVECDKWLEALLAAGRRVILPSIVEFEVRRELLRAGKTRSIALLDELVNTVEYVAIDQIALNRASILWAEARRKGRPGAGKQALDGDIILVAQIEPLELDDPIVATSNLRHFELFLKADHWTNIA